MIVTIFTAVTVSAQEKINWLAGASGATYYPVSVGITSAIKKAVSLDITIVTTGGSVENVRRLAKKQGELSLAFSPDVSDAWNGVGAFKNKINNLRTIGRIYSAIGHMVVLEDSGIKSVFDLKGHKVHAGPTGSGASVLFELFFKHIKLWDEIKPTYLHHSDCINVLSDRNISTMWALTAIPTGIVSQLTATHKIRLLPLYEIADSSGFLKKYPGYHKATIPAGMYKGVDREVQTIAADTVWIVEKDVPDELVYKMTKAAYSDEGIKISSAVHKSTAEMKSGNPSEDMPIPLHPGAIKYWKERSLLK